jgi:hypothetical protein
LFQRAYSHLNGLKLRGVKNKKSQEVTLSAYDARKIAELFFRPMLSTTVERVQRIVASNETYNTAQIRLTEAAGADRAAPDAIMRRLSVRLSDMATTDMPRTLKCLLFIVSVVRLRDV